MHRRFCKFKFLRAIPLLLFIPCAAQAHQIDFTEVKGTFKLDGAFEIDVLTHADSLLLGLPPGSFNEEDYHYLMSLPKEELERRQEGLRDYFRRMVRVRFDGQPFEFQVGFPEEGAPPTPGNEELKVLGGTVRLSGAIPPQAKEFTFSASRVFGPVVLTLSWEGGEPVVQPLDVGTSSVPFSLDRPKPTPWHEVLGQYVVLGFLHIVPKGLDHIMFVLGLFLLSTQLRPLLWQVTAFTVAHSVSLGLSMYGIVTLPGSVVEPLVALSIASVAIENLFTSKLTPWRPAVVFAFGLLHGLSFAGVLAQWGLPRQQFVTGLVAFNIGVELGQLSIIAAAFLFVGWFRKQEWYRRRVVIPISVEIAVVGLYWAITRLMS